MIDPAELAGPGSEEQSLVSQLDFDRLPRHIAVIMDGNGRWARERRLPRVAGHRAGIDAVREIVEEGAGEAAAVLNEYNAISDSFAEPLEADEMDKLIERQSKLQEKIDLLDAWDLDSRLELAMEALRCPPGDSTIDQLSGGERRRVALCRLLLQKPDILLLDEPTNHLDIDSIRWLEEFLLRANVTLVFVTHDRAFLRNLASRIVELDRGKLFDFACDYDTFLQRKEELLHGEGQEWQRFDKKLAEEEVWIRKGIKARRTRNEGRVRALKKMREEHRQRRDRIGA